MAPSTAQPDRKLSKKQLKANSFHNKKSSSTKKNKQQEEQAPFPEPDSLPPTQTPQQTKKRKLPETAPQSPNEQPTTATKKRKQLLRKDMPDNVLNPTALAKAQLRKRRKEIKKLKAEKKKVKEETGKISGGDEKQECSEEEKVSDDTKRRFIVFVGNLPFKATKQEVEEHFKTAGDIVSCRLLTDKKTKKPKGFAFIEYKDSLSLSRALHFHHTLFLKRELNVELTAGGGGSKSEARKAKIDQKRAHLEEERRNYHEKNVVPGKASKNEGKPSAEITTRRAANDDKSAKKKTKKPTIEAVKRPARLDGANAITLNDSNRRVIGRKESE